ncbi:hypothetical protein V3C99_015750, partial [Haemonchus contortus]
MSSTKILFAVGRPDIVPNLLMPVRSV